MNDTPINETSYEQFSCSLTLKFRLLRYGYSLYIKPHYCGAAATALKPRPGEDWLRGSDLRDGKWWAFPRVLWDIVCYEMYWGRWKVK